MKILLFSEINKELWNSLCVQSSHGWLFHRYEWIEIESGFFPQDNRSFGVVHDNRLIGIVPLYQMELGHGDWSERLLHSGLHRHAGIALEDGLDRLLIKSARSEVMLHLQRIATDNQVDRIQLSCQNLAPFNLNNAREEIPFWVASYGYFLGMGIGQNGLVPCAGVANCCADQIVELSKPTQTLFSLLSEACRRAIRKAQKANVQVREDWEYCVDEYYRIAKLSAQRTGEALMDQSYFENVFNFFGKHRECKILFANVNGENVAALFLLIDKGAAHFLGGVSDPRYLQFRVNDFLHWSAIVWAKENQLLYYRLGPVFPGLPDFWPVQRVSKFKSKFGGKSVPVIQGSYFLKPEKYLSQAISHLSILMNDLGSNDHT